MNFFVLMVSLSFHEAAHAWSAHLLGDDTAKRMGRLSLNPLVHMDFLGSLLILTGAPLGWAKPVPVNPHNLRNPRAAMPLVSFAGPLANLVLMILGCVVFFFAGDAITSQGWNNLLGLFIRTNVGLAIFNLLPVYPLDGSKIITTFMSDRVADRYEEIMTPLGIFPILIIVALGSMGPNLGLLSFWFRFWRPLIYPIFSLFNVPYGLYPG